MSILMEISELLQNGKAKEIKDAVQKAIDQGLGAKEILENGMMHGMSIIGEKFSKNEIFVPEMLIAARAMNVGIDVLKSHFVGGGVEKKGLVILGTVKGDLHDIGKNLVKIMMEGKGLEVIDLGIDVPREKFIEKVKESGAKIVALSALLTTTMTEMTEVIKAFKDAGIREQVKIMIGGAPVTDKFKEDIGADLYAPDAAQAANVAIAACS
jgi:corrinoid protein of di/trimethylamine methyltransferase